jgi:hypothetical protein
MDEEDAPARHRGGVVAVEPLEDGAPGVGEPMPVVLGLLAAPGVSPMAGEAPVAPLVPGAVPAGYTELLMPMEPAAVALEVRVLPAGLAPGVAMPGLVVEPAPSGPVVPGAGAAGAAVGAGLPAAWAIAWEPMTRAPADMPIAISLFTDDSPAGFRPDPLTIRPAAIGFAAARVIRSDGRAGNLGKQPVVDI